MTKDYILSEIKRTAALNGNVPLGSQRFCSETGVKYTDWHGKYWSRWGDAVREAGYARNTWKAAHPEDHLLAKLVDLIRELRTFPVQGDLRMRSRQDPTFPSHNTFGRFGSKAQLVARVVTYCTGRPEFEDACAALR